MKTLTWLHLSDWHQKGPNFDQQVVRDALILDIHTRVKIDPALAQIDFIVFSGDLAFSGQSSEYEVAQKYLLDPILAAAGVKADRLFCVPGNHDLSRDTVRVLLPSELQKPLGTHDLVQNWLTNPINRGHVLEPFEAYRKFISGYTGQPSPDYASILWLEIEGEKIALLGLNSAWMCGRIKDDQGEINDYGYALVGEPQIHDALAQIASADMRIAVLHHPFDFLSEFDRNRVEDQLQRQVHFILRGHEHKPKVSALQSTSGDCVVIPAGASFLRRAVDDPRYTNAYNFVHLNFDEGKGIVYLRRWSDPQNKWIEDTDTYTGGKFVLGSLPKIGQSNPFSITDSETEIKHETKETKEDKEKSQKPGKIITNQKSRLSDRLTQDPNLNLQYHSFKDKWVELASSFIMIPGLFKNWLEYCDSLDQMASSLIPLRDWVPEDLFILCCAIYLHKIGLIPNNSSNQQVRYILDQYPLLSKNYILEFGKQFNLDEGRTEDIAWVCYGHRDLINKNKTKTGTLSHQELALLTKKGQHTRAEIAFCLRILSRLGAFNARLPDLATEIYFRDKSASDFADFRMNSVVAGIELLSTPENADYQVLLKAHLSENDPVEDIRILQKAREQLEDTFRECPSHTLGNFFENATVELDYVNLSDEIKKIVLLPRFAQVIQDATKKSIDILLKSRYEEGALLLKGWGPMVFFPRNANPPSRKIPKEIQEARVANTAEVILAFTGWLEIAAPQEDSIAKVIEIINAVIPTLKFAQVKNITGQMSKPKESPGDIENPDRSITAAGQFNPLASLTFKVPTTRANSLFVLAATHLLKEMEKYPDLTDSKEDIQLLLRECISWLCTANTGPFSEKIIERLPNEYLFQSILAFRALINTKEYWMNLSVGFKYDLVIQKIADFVHSFMRQHNVDQGWPAPVFKAMALEIFLFYRSQSDLRFNKKPLVDKLIRSIIQELLNEINLRGSPVWKDDNQTLMDEDRKNTRPWTHVTSAWAIEGLTRCMAAHMLTPEQKSKLLQTIPMILLKQDGYGFYESEPHPDAPQSITIHHIFKTAVYTYALTQVRKNLLSS